VDIVVVDVAVVVHAANVSGIALVSLSVAGSLVAVVADSITVLVVVSIEVACIIFNFFLILMMLIQ
jgi:hypothetical protein